MARVRVVTRSIEDCIVEVTAMATIDGKKTLVEKALHLGGQVAREKSLGVAQKMYNSDEFKVVEVNHFRREMTIYGMLETDFIRLARPMDNERKFITADGTEVSLDDADTEDAKEEETAEPTEPTKEKPNKK